MSLINDALKRAKRAQVRQPTTIGADPLLQPVIHTASGPSGFVPFIPLLSGVTLILAVGCLLLWWRSAHRPLPTKEALRLLPNSVVAAQPVVPRIEPVAMTNLAVDPRELADQPAHPSPSAEGSPAAPALSVFPPKATPAEEGNASSRVALEASRNTSPVSSGLSEATLSELKLQGIFYRAANASALIDGQTVFVGDEIEGAKVTAIDRRSVKLERKGRPIVLKLR